MNVNKLLKECIEELKELKIPVSDNIVKNVKIMEKSLSTFGTCQRQYDTYTISIAKRLIEVGGKALKQTMYHELLHTCPNCMNHGARWKMYASIVSREYGVNIKRTTNSAELGLPPVKGAYTIQCTCCGNTYSRTKMSAVIKNPERYRCGKCNGRLERI